MRNYFSLRITHYALRITHCFDGGDRGGELIACGTPEEVARVENSYTGQALQEQLGIRN